MPFPLRLRSEHIRQPGTADDADLDFRRTSCHARYSNGDAGELHQLDGENPRGDAEFSDLYYLANPAAA